MSSYRSVIAGAVAAALAAACATTERGNARRRRQGRASAGRRLPQEIAAWDISIPPSGAGLPAGSGTPKQGAAVYVAQCQACHGEKGAGKPADALVGGIGSSGPPSRS